MKALFALIALPLIAATAFAQDPSYSAQALSTGDRADDLAAADIDGDGHPDLIVQSGLDLRFFLFHPGEGFRKEADRTLRLDSETFLWALSKFCDGERPAVVTTSSRGIHRYAPADGGFAPKSQDLIVHPCIFEGKLAPNTGPLHLDFMRDLTGDGLADAILFQRGEIFVLPQERGRDGHPEFRLSQKLAVPIDTGLIMLFGPHQKVKEVTSVPVLAFGDLNGDKRADIGYYQNDMIGAWYMQENGRFSARDPLAVGEKRKPRQSYLKFEVPPAIVDLNGDGLLDVVVVYASKGRANIFMNRDGKLDFTNPDSVLEIRDSWSTGAFIRDLDGDGKMEIVMGIIRRLGIAGGAAAFVSKKIEVELHVFHWDARAGGYTNSPVQQLTFQIPFTFQATRESANVDVTFRPTFDADVDGDGRFDLIVENEGDPRTLDIYRGVAGKTIADKPNGAIHLDPPEGTVSTLLFTADFNGDRRNDLVLRYVSADKTTNQVEVRLSK